MEHTARKKDGSEDLKILPECTLPLTGVGVVDLVITDLGVFEIGAQGLTVIEIADGVTEADVSAKTGVPVDFSRLH
jgi:3-oxoacid CoA-transferase subunit B